MKLNYTVREAAQMMGLPPPREGGDSVMTGVSTDTRTLQSGDLFFALAGERYDADSFVADALARGAAATVSHGVHAAGRCLRAENPLDALQRLAGAHRARCKARVIAITGSCGKTTAKEMTAALLASSFSVISTRGNLNNEIGCPLSLMTIMPDTRYAVIEMGANHPGEIADLCRMARPEESTVMMVAPAHLEGFGSIENVASAKAEIMEALPPDGCFYVNMDDPRCRAMGERYAGEKVAFGSEGDVVLDHIAFDDSGEMLLDIRPVGRLRLPLKVRAHAANVLFAVAVGLRHGIVEFEGPLRAMCENAPRFKTCRVGGVLVLDDSYNANPASMRAALETLAETPGGAKIAVLGAMFELGISAVRLHREVGEFAASLGVDCLIAQGPNAEDIVAGACAGGLADAVVAVNHESAAALLRDRVCAGDVVLIKGSRAMKMESIIEMMDTTISDEH